MLLHDTALNGLWAGFCLLALAYHFRREIHTLASTPWQRCCRTLAVILACVSLFPCVSASDDSVRFQYYESTHQSQAPNGNQPKKAPDLSLATLVRLLEALESVQISVIWALAVTLFSFALASIQFQCINDRALPSRSGRAPPVPFLQTYSC